VVAVVAFGLSLMSLGYFQRRRLVVRTHADDRGLTTD
jgi:hypothetical protein